MNTTFRNALLLLWMMPLLVLGPGNANAQSDGDRALMERERQVRERLRAEEEKRRQDEFYEQRRKQNEQSQKDQEKRNAEMWGPKPSDGASYPSGGNSAAPAVDKARRDMQKLPPLAADRNPLLGKWKLDKTKQRQTNPLAEFNAMFGGGVCEMFFGEGIWEFRAKTIVGIDQGIGEMVLSETEYRGGKDLVAVLPKKGLQLLVFKFTGPDRIEEGLVSAGAPCTMVRVGSSAAATQGNVAGNAPSTTAGRVTAQPPVQTANASPTPPVSSRPPPEVCRQTLLDKLGTVGVNQVRAMSDVRFKEPAIEGKVPNTGNLRIDLRGSACDDPRINATLYDFDANGMLQSITFVWARPPGPAPAPIFTERVKTLSLFHSLPPPQSASRLQADTSLGRLILEDLPERNLLLEAYRAPK